MQNFPHIRKEMKWSEVLEENEGQVLLPFTGGTTSKVGRLVSKYRFHPVFCPLVKLRQLLRPVKDGLGLCVSEHPVPMAEFTMGKLAYDS